VSGGDFSSFFGSSKILLRGVVGEENCEIDLGKGGKRGLGPGRERADRVERWFLDSSSGT